MFSTYKKLSLVKIALGSLIIFLTVAYVNVYANEALGISFFLLGTFLLSWGASYFAFRLLQYAMKQYHKYEHEKMTEAYKLGLFIVTNAILLVMQKWTRLIGINILLAFIVLQILLIYDRDTND
jgi:uncharacterized membrane protein YkgB